MKFLGWLSPGLGFKRWIFVILCGLFCAAEGLAVAQGSELISLLERPILNLVLKFTGEGEPFRVLTGGLIIILGLFVISLGFNRLMKNILTDLAPGAGIRWREKLLLRYSLKKGPQIVVLGGGTGLSTLLRGLKEVTSNITAIVTVTDDGGSSGRLRGDLGMLPPGDIRNCLVALADQESSLERLFNYRFPEGGELAGHNMGNLLLAGLTQETGNLARAVQEIGTILAVRGQVLPVTLDNVVLIGEKADGRVLKGETNMVAAAGPIKKVILEPRNATPLKEAIAAILAADVIILGPGSLYTSVIPNLLVPGISEAIRKAQANTYYVCNIMTQPGETDGYRASHHLKAIINHCGKGIINKVILNNQVIVPEVIKKYQAEGAEPVEVDLANFKNLGVEIIQHPLCGENNLARHDPKELLAILMQDIQSKRRV